MKVVYFGDYSPSYARNRVLLRGLALQGVDVIQCVTDKKGIDAKQDLENKFKDIVDDYDCVIVGYSDSRWVVPFVKKLTKKPIVWDAFYSLYDAWIFDKKLAGRFSLKALYYWLSDWRSCRLANAVLLDTKAHVQYFNKKFFVPKDKLHHLLVGTDDTVMKPQEVNDKPGFLVSFLGKYIPLQGPQYIIRAAKLLEENTDIQFQMIGSGQLYKRCQEIVGELQVQNISFIKPIPYEDMPAAIAPADVTLGIFGDTDKTQRVIPNKVYESAALAKAIISADTPAIRELFTHEKDVFLCEAANPEALAAAIQRLYDDKELRESIAKGARKTFEEKATPEIIGERFISLLQTLI
ncbi:MAG: glycosyltransferase [Patescibacteria group bacterium]